MVGVAADRGGAAAVERDDQRRARDQPAQEAGQGADAEGGGDRQMKRARQLDRRLAVALAQRLGLLAQQRAQAQHLRRVEFRRRLARHAGFQNASADEDVVRVGDGRRADEGAAIALDGDDVVVGERLEGAAHDGAAGVEQRADLLLRQLGARRQAVVDDGVEDRGIDIRRAVAFPARGSRSTARTSVGASASTYSAAPASDVPCRPALDFAGDRVARRGRSVYNRDEIVDTPPKFSAAAARYVRAARPRRTKEIQRIDRLARAGTALAVYRRKPSDDAQEHGRIQQSRTGETHQALRRDDGGAVDRPARAGRRLLLPARSLRLRQDLDAAHDRRPRERQRGRHPDRRRQRHRAAARPARHGDDVSELRAVPAPELRRQCRVLAEDARRRQGRRGARGRWSSSSSSP